MKGEFQDDPGDTNTNNNVRNMFPKFHTPPPLHPTPLYPHHHHHHHHHDAAAASSAVPPPKKSKPATHEDGSSIEVPRRPRGRPPGSKNKPKPPVVITREPDPAMSPYILEIPGGSDIVESLTRFTRRRNVGLCVITAIGSVSNVSLRQPGAASAGTVTFHGRLEILSLSAVLLCGGLGNNTASFGSNGYGGTNNGGFTITLGGPQGQIVGGKVVGELTSAGTVYVVATSFNNPTFHRLPVDEESPGEEQQSGGAGGGGDGGSPVSGGGGESSGGIGMYNCHLGSDVIWAPSARPPPPPHY